MIPPNVMPRGCNCQGQCLRGTCPAVGGERVGASEQSEEALVLAKKIRSYCASFAGGARPKIKLNRPELELCLIALTLMVAVNEVPPQYREGIDRRGEELFGSVR